MFHYITQPAQQDPLMWQHLLLVRLPFGYWIRFELRTRGSEPARNYKTSGKWIEVGPRLHFRYGRKK